MFRKIALFAFIILFTINLFSQDVISNQGDSYTDSSASIDFTIGEVVTSTVSNSERTLTQGFHQTNWSFVSIENHVPNYEAIIFPNPTDDFLNIKAISFKNVNYSLFDEMGKLVFNGTLYSEKTSLDVSKLHTGLYSLVLNNPENKLKTFNIIKTR
tara:strand:+ start:116 stop:583 length:468 start_codon:yes stop_codon:yes gene_type:complete